MPSFLRASLRCLLGSALLTGCVMSAPAGVSAPNSDPVRSIGAVLDTTAAGWNRGDLSAYLSAYTDGATEMLSTGPTGGRDAIERTMREGFWRTGRPLQQLHYEHVDVRMLGPEHALVTGRFVLTGGERPERSGWFTTVWSLTPNGWRMIHDHS
jgi:uncharacterized protein (TIGR02246 family)